MSQALTLSRRPSAWIVAIAALAASAPATAADKDKVRYNRDVRPILSETCFACHGPDSASRKADLRLDKRDDAITAGALAPGKLDESELVARIESHERDEVMPPPSTKKTLTAGQKATLKRWVAEGAEYEPHWSLIAPKRPELPRVEEGSTWVRTPIDRFILSALERKGLRPAPEADRRTLARRVSLDLTGLPPAPEEVEAFVNDKAPDAYEKLVDKLLASPRWGEHRARYWLDAARYADTHGIHFDNFREMWSYRDWVIGAFNRNMPFDRFTVEQLAGDLLPNPTLEQKVATGFNRCNITTNEGGAIDEEYLVLYARDRTETVSQVFLGMTAGCAVCHDHKFDPLSQREFYELSAFFNNTTQAAMDGNTKDTPPSLFVPLEADRARWAKLTADRDENRKAVEARKAAVRPEFDKFLASATPESVAKLIPTRNQSLQFMLDPRDGAKAKRGPGPALELAEAGDYERDKGFSYGAWVRFSKGDQSGALLARMDDQHDYRGWDLWVEGNRIAAHFVHKWPEDAIKAATKAQINRGVWTHVFVTYDGSSKAEGIKLYLDGVPQATNITANSLKNTIRTEVPLKVGQRHTGSRTLDDTQIHDLRTYSRTLSPEEVKALVGSSKTYDLVAKLAKERPAAEVEEAFGWWLGTSDGPSKELVAKGAKLDGEEAALKSRGTVAHVMNERSEAAMAYLLYRGDYDKRKDPVKADTPDCLPAMPSDLPKNRLGLAQWLLRPENPLTARVTVNRAWQELFGTGLVRTAGDFGVSGELPSHPELLDWLAVEFREGGWDFKKLYKMMVMSSAYRQAAEVTKEKLDKDRDNRLVSRGPRFRMDAEMVRDYALATSGLLVGKIGGPSVRPYQPDGVWEAVAMPESNTRIYKRDSGESLYRRSLYTFWKRAAPPASMDIFNAPAREVCTVRRERTNTPLQALVTLNDVQFVEAARVLAERVLKEECDCECGDDARLNVLASRLLDRPFRGEELKIVKASLDDLLKHYKADVADAKKLLAVGESKSDPKLDPAVHAAWTMLANELMNLDEVLNK